MLGKSEYYDAWNPSARALFYGFSKAAMFDIGVAALWLDATEPEVCQAPQALYLKFLTAKSIFLIGPQ